MPNPVSTLPADSPLHPDKIAEALEHTMAFARLVGAFYRGLVAAGVPHRAAVQMTTAHFRPQPETGPAASFPSLDMMRRGH